MAYNSEIWGLYTKSNIKSNETVHQLKKKNYSSIICKRYLEVSNKASKVVCSAELGRFHLIIVVDQRILN